LGLLVALVAPASAGNIGVHAGWIDTDQAGDDAGWGILLDFNVSEHVQIELRGTDFREMTTQVEGSDFNLQMTTIDLGFTYNFFKETWRLTPYVGGGGTYFLLDSTPDSKGRIEDEYGWYGVAGLDFPIAKRWNIYLEGMWRDAKMAIKGNDLGFEPTVDQGVNLNGPQVNLGIAFHW
jgi:outer membrane protein W